MTMIVVKIMDIFSCNQNFEMHKMAEIEEEECATLWQRELAPYFVK